MSPGAAPGAGPIRFGTDGVRGPAGQWPLVPEGMQRLGRAIAAWAGEQAPSPVLVLGRDPRDSGPALAQALTEGLTQGGATVLDGGIMPTPAVSCAVAACGAAGGVVLTASHNPWQDNGIKVLAPGGGKLLDPRPVERWLDQAPRPGGGRVQPLVDPLEPWLRAMPALDLSGLRVLFDGAHGATALAGPRVLEQRGATLVLRGCAPTGRNVNAGVGALHPPDDLLGCDLGILLDGDGDRLLLIDPVHGPLDGDDLLWLLAGAESGPVVGTVMANAGLEAALDGRLVRVPVGDRFVAQAMAETGARVGGEPSGHLLIAGGPPTSCGLFTALSVLAATAGADGRPRLPLPVGGWTRWPQARADVRREGLPAHLAAADAARGAGLRVLVRASGTEPVVRVMVEGPDRTQAQSWCSRVVAELEAAG